MLIAMLLMLALLFLMGEHFALEGYFFTSVVSLREKPKVYSSGYNLTPSRLFKHEKQPFYCNDIEIINSPF